MAPPRKPVVKRYRFSGDKLAHRLRAEQALGKPLPLGAQVHHADGSKADNAPLVICQDQAYHSLLHVRARILSVGGDPDTQRICTGCKQVVDIENMGKRRPDAPGRNGPVTNQCKPCIAIRASKWYARKTRKAIA